MPGEISGSLPAAELDEDERQELAAHAKALEAIARCLADVEDYPEQQHYMLADDVLLALHNAGLDVIERR